MNVSQDYLETPTLRNERSSNCTIDAPFQYFLFPTVYSVVFVLGLVGNVTALYVFLAKVKRYSPSYVYFVNLAVVDVLYVCTLPFRIFYHVRQNDWLLGDVMCKITGTLYFANIYISIAFLSCVCVDRYIAVVHPRRYLRIKNTRYPKVTVAFVWVGALAIMLPLVFDRPLSYRLENNTTACFESFPAETWSERMAAYNAVVFLSGFLVPFSIIAVCYPLMARKVSRLRDSERKAKALKMIYLILAISAVCFLPYHLTHLLHLLSRLNFIRDCALKSFLYKSRRVTMAFASFNSCLDPLLYYIASADFRLGFLRKAPPPQRVYSITCQRFERLSLEDARLQK